MNVKPLLDFIARFESRGDYNIVWGDIAVSDRPRKPLVRMTIAQVLAWQDSIDREYQSEAAGRYQIMEDTLRGLASEAGLSGDDLFNEANQDRLAIALLKRRGLDKFLAGKISAETFANALAHEWASLPIVSGKGKGRSAYAGDGLNKSHVSVDEFMAAVRAVKATAPLSPKPVDVSLPAPAVTKSPWAALVAFIIAIFRKGN
jgi:muramidase (phage lysozyme)